MNELQPLAVKPKQGGYTIMELSIALTIIAILIVSGIVGISAVLRSNKANIQLEDSGRTLTRLQAYVSTAASTPGLSTAGGIGLGLFPSTRVFGSSVFNAFGTSGTASEFVSAYATQSPTTINPDLLAQTENFFVGHLSSQQEVDCLCHLQVAFQGCENAIRFNRTPGLMQVLTQSHRYVIPMQATLYDGRSLLLS